MAALTSYNTYSEWRRKHWNNRTMHTPTKIQRAVFDRIDEDKRRLIDIIDNPTKTKTEKVKRYYDNDFRNKCDYEIVCASGKKVLLVWATFY